MANTDEFKFLKKHTKQRCPHFLSSPRSSLKRSTIFHMIRDWGGEGSYQSVQSQVRGAAGIIAKQSVWIKTPTPCAIAA